MGREKLHYLNAVPINDIAERWITRYDRVRVRALSDLKHALEAPAMPRPIFVYTIYIRTTPERLWHALTDPAVALRWWGMTCQSEWQVGAPMTWERDGVTLADPAQVVLESEPYRRLAFTWLSFTPELARVNGASEEYFAKLAAEPRSRVAFDLEPVGETVKLTVTHDGFEPGSAVAELVSKGWPEVLSSLKSLLETDEPLDTH
jgi:uncharacterized protein YndB with AHSA1/START domain